MVTVVVERAARERCAGGGNACGRSPISVIRVEGHAGFAGHGSDIVCSAASVTIYTAAGALAEICGGPAPGTTERAGYFELNVPEYGDWQKARDAQVILEAARVGFRQIEASYPRHLRVKEV